MCVMIFNIFCVSTVMKMELATIAATYALYTISSEGKYDVSWKVQLFAIVIPILILKFTKDLDMKAKMFILAVLVWHIINLLNSAIGEPRKNDELVYKNAYIESDASGVDAGVGPATTEVSLECGKTQDHESRLGTQDMGSESTQGSM
jgi:hypothetical protein